MTLSRWFTLMPVHDHLGLTSAEKLQLRKACLPPRKLALDIVTRWFVPTIVIWLLVGTVIAGVSIAPIPPMRAALIAVVCFVVVAAVVWMLFARSTRRRTRSEIRQHLEQMGISRCTKCGYRLHSDVNCTCPECGAAVNRIAR